MRAAVASLSDYQPEARVVIEAEFKRRDLSAKPVEVDDPMQAYLDSLGLASRGKRFLALIIDWSIGLAPLFLGIGYADTPDGLATSGIVFGFAFALCYTLFADALPGGSLGKRVLKMRVIVFATGRECGLWRSLGRNAPMHIFTFFDLMFIFGELRQRLGDKIAGTVVVNVDVGGS